MSDRLIIDNVVVLFESMHTMMTRMKGKEGFMALKFDMSKTYDMIEWFFLKSMMEKMGFAQRWITFVMKYVTLVSYSLLINGAP